MLDTKKYKILIAEDEEMLSDIYEMEFIKNGYEVVIAKDGNEVIKLVESFKPDLVLLDIMLPYLDGLEVLPRIKERLPKLSKIVMFSSLFTPENIAEARKNGAIDFIVKPNYTPKELIEKVSTYFSN